MTPNPDDFARAERIRKDRADRIRSQAEATLEWAEGMDRHYDDAWVRETPDPLLWAMREGLKRDAYRIGLNGAREADKVLKRIVARIEAELRKRGSRP